MDRYIIWDFDGTLAYNQHKWTQTMQKVLSDKYLVNEPAEKIKPYLLSGFPWHDWQKSHEYIKSDDEYWELIYNVFKKIYEALKIEKKLHAQISRDFREEYLRRENWFLYPDTIPTLEQALRGQYISIILSNNIPEMPEIAKTLGIDKYFKRVFVSAKIGYEKPHGKAFEAALQGIKQGRDTWMVGDSYAADITGAESAGLKAVLVRNEHQGAAHFSKDLTGIWQYINR